MRKLVELTAAIALLCIGAHPALADGPTVSAQPNIQPGANGSTAGGSASASGGNAGPATVGSSEPITASSSNSAGSTGQSGSTSATAPGTSATVPTTAFASEPEPAAPDGSTPTPATSGPSATADASRTNVSTSDSRVRVDAVATARAAFGGSVAGIGSAEDPTNATTCSTAEASPGVPTDASLGTSCGTGPSTASEDFSANDAGSNRAGGAPAGSACLDAHGSAGPSPTTEITGTCAGQGASAFRFPTTGGQTTSGGANGAATPDARSSISSAVPTVLGMSLPSSATASVSVTLLGAALGVAGVVLLRQSRRKTNRFVTREAISLNPTDQDPSAISRPLQMTRFANKVGRSRISHRDYWPQRGLERKPSTAKSVHD